MRFNSLMEPSSACSYVATQRGGVALLFEGHRYNKVRDGKDGTVYWRCSRDRQCPGRAVTVNNRVKKSNNKHNHPPEASLMLRNGSGSLTSTSSHSHSSSNATSRYSGTSDSSTMMAAAAAYASFLHGSNSVGGSAPANPIKHGSNSNKSSQLANNNSISITPQSRIPSAHHNSPLSSSPMELSVANSNNNNTNNNNNNGKNSSNNSNFQSAFSFLQNLASNNYSNNSASHLLANNPLLANHHSNEYGRPAAMNLSSSSSSNSNNLDSQSANLYSLSNHFNMIHHHRNALESSFKMAAQNSRPPTPPPTSYLNSRTLHHQYSKMFKSKHYSSNKSTNSPFDSTFDPQTFNRRVTSNTTLQSTNSPPPPPPTSSLDIVDPTLSNIKSNNSPVPTPPSSASSLFGMNQSQNNANNFSNENTTGYQENLASAMLQDVFQEAQAAAVAAAAFPSLLNETFKFLSATAATNPQMAAALASTLSNQNLLKNFDLTMATATAAAVVAASNNSSNNSNNNGNQSSRSVSEKIPSIDDLINHSSFASLGTSFPSDLVNSSPFYQEDQPLNMALKDKSNILKLLRSLMRAGTGMQQHYNNDLAVPAVESFHALVIPTADAHGSEYIAPCDARRTFLTNFTGSAGTAVVTMNEAALWTDGRYFLQAARELDQQNWILMKQFQPDTPSIGEWLNKVLPHGSKIGVDPFTISYSGWTKLQEELLLCGNQLVQTPINLIDQIWTWRPARSSEAVFPLDIKFAGKSWNDKLIEIRQEMAKKDASLLVLTALDDIAWLFNLRGSDIEYNPVFFSYAAVTQNRAYLFIDECKLTTQTLKHLSINDSVNVLNDSKSSSSSTRSTPSAASTNVGQPLSPESVKNENNNNPDATNSGNVIEIRPYETIVEFLRSYISLKFNDKIWISNKSSYALVSLIPESRRILTGVSPVCCRKAIKNPVELDGMRRAHIKDAVALCELFAWIEDEVVNKKKSASTTMDTTTTVDPMSPNSSSTSSSSSGQYSIVDELNVDLKLEELRRKQKEYVGPSFATIAGSGPNSAVIHYKSSEATNRPITTEEIFLLDCGAQYRDGTTDVTRTIHLGTPSNYEKECFTRVVKGHISLAQARFPRLTKGQFLDAYARRALWDVGLDYNHGTGHGVGMFLNVHEPPIGIANRINMDDPGLDENMILSNEPGFYEPNKFGIRIESLVITKKDNLKYNFNERGYLGFETITLLPIQTKLLDLSLLTNDEIKWIDDFHQLCREIIGSELEKQGQQRALQWLLNETNPIMK